mmetsp:Transcript_3662/g.10364  ORF Transcript_3662/g.10364 Transcript_3662/m.10364 type:complete len:340 (-) Transcript_3662:373-1392(-)
MTKLLVVLLGALCSASSKIGIMLMLAGRAIGYPMALLPPRACRHCFGGKRTGFPKTSGITRRMIATTRPPDAVDVETLSCLPDDLNPWFDLVLPEGRCVGVETGNETQCFAGVVPDQTTRDHWIHSVFHGDEIALGMGMEASRNSFWLGRLAMRIALDFPDYPILRDGYGRPEVRRGSFGSISHKRNRGVAIVSPSVIDQGNSDFALSGVGIDLEMTSRPGRPSLARRILTPDEQAALGAIPGLTVEQEVLLRFSLKEAIYKAAHPLLCQYVGFKEAEVTPFPDGTASCRWLLDNEADRPIAKLTAHWRTIEDGNYFLTSASVYSRSDFEARPVAECKF